MKKETKNSNESLNRLGKQEPKNIYHMPILILLAADYEENNQVKKLLFGDPPDRVEIEYSTASLFWDVSGQESRFKALQDALVGFGVPFEWYNNSDLMWHGDRRIYRPAIEGNEEDEEDYLHKREKRDLMLAASTDAGFYVPGLREWALIKSQRQVESNHYHWPVITMLNADYEKLGEIYKEFHYNVSNCSSSYPNGNGISYWVWETDGYGNEFSELLRNLAKLNIPFNWENSKIEGCDNERRYFRPEVEGINERQDFTYYSDEQKFVGQGLMDLFLSELHALQFASPPLEPRYWAILELPETEYYKNNAMIERTKKEAPDLVFVDMEVAYLVWVKNGDDNRFKILQKDLIQMRVPFDFMSNTAEKGNLDRRFFRPAIEGKDLSDVTFCRDTEWYSGSSLRALTQKQLAKGVAATNHYNWPSLSMLISDYNNLKYSDTKIFDCAAGCNLSSDDGIVHLIWETDGAGDNFIVLMQRLVRGNIPFDWKNTTIGEIDVQRRFFRPAVEGKEKSQDVVILSCEQNFDGTSLYELKQREAWKPVSTNRYRANKPEKCCNNC